MNYIQLRKKLIWSGLLCAILDDDFCAQNNRNVFLLGKKLFESGVDIVQYRFKSISDKEAFSVAKKLVSIARKKKKMCIINDRADIAYLSDAHGIHIGQTDIPAKEVRKLLGKNKIIGRTVHCRREFNEAKKEPVDYISLGPVYLPGIKGHLCAWGLNPIVRLAKKSRKPVFVIGGITPQNVPLVVKENITNIAVGKALLNASHIKKTVSLFKESICSKKVSYKR